MSQGSFSVASPPPRTTEEEGDNEYAGCCVLLLGAGLVALMSYFFINDYTFYKGQLPAMCIDGRLQGQPVQLTQFALVQEEADSGDNPDWVQMNCKIPVNVYRCPSDDAEGCPQANLASLKVMPQRSRKENTEVRCIKEGGWAVGANKCQEAKWECATGACTAYEKGQRLCVPKLRRNPYLCYFELYDSSSGVRDAPSTFPIWTLLCLIASVILMCGCFGCVIKWLHSKNLSLAKGAMSVCLWGTGIAICVWIISLISSAAGWNAEKKPIQTRFANLTVFGDTNGSDGLVLSNNSMVPMEAAPKFDLWTNVWAIIAIIVLVLLCLCTCVFFAFLLRDLCKGCSGERDYSDVSDEEEEED